MRKVFFLCGFLCTLIFIYSQQRSISFNSHCFIPDSGQVNCYITYRIAYNKLVFVKENGSYSTGISIFYEIKNGEEIVKRITSSKTISVSTYDETVSAKLFIEDISEFTIPQGTYEVVPSIAFSNTRDIVPLRDYSFSLAANSKDEIVVPEIIFSGNFTCDGVSGKKIVNLKNTIPFDDKKYDLILTVTKPEINKITVEVFQDEKLVQQKKIDKFLTGNPALEVCEENIYYSLRNGTNNYKIFLLPNINEELLEGTTTINILSGSDTLLTSKCDVVWINRPLILSNIDLAAEIYAKITDDKNIREIYDAPKNEYYKSLFEYWKKFDPVKSTSFNELMNEFYNRADIANEKYQTTDKISGARTDRGRVYIKYGEPDSINRSYNRTNKIVESWHYDKLDRDFVFEDTYGLGNYKLVE